MRLVNFGVYFVFMLLGTTRGSSDEECECGDELPPGSEFDCEAQKNYDKCGEDFMQGYCICTCGATCVLPEREKTTGTCLAVFDFDDTLKLHDPSRVAGDAEMVVQHSLDMNYGVGIASASCAYDFLKDFLFNNIIPGYFNDEFVNSNRFRICNTFKRQSLEDILSYYSASFECTMFFDDSDYRHQFQDTELIYTQVERGVGVTWSEFQKANRTLWRQCDCVSSM